MENSNLPGAPELPGKKAPASEDKTNIPEGANSPTPQLLRSTQPAPAEPAKEEPVEDDALNEHIAEPADPDGVIAAEQQRQWEAEHPRPPAEFMKKRRGRAPLIITVVAIVLFAAAAYYWFGMRKVSAPSPQHTTQVTQPSAPKPEQIDSQPLKHYDSTQHTFGIDYPSDWTMNDTDTAFTLTSSVYTFTDSRGVKTTGKLILNVQEQQSAIPDFPSTGALAVLDSDKLAYKKPGASQRAETYLSYLGYANTVGLDRLFVTGDNGYKTDQTIPQSDLTGMNTLISVKFVKCDTKACANPTEALSVQASSWKSTAAARTVQTVIQSISFS